MKEVSGKIISQFSRVTSSTAYMPEVDGLRFVAIAWVVLFHLMTSMIKKATVDPGWANPIYRILITGNQGVLLFFIISGFVLCLPFARHHIQNEKKVSLKSYYFRRVVRIEPPYIICCVLLFILLVVRGKYSLHELLPHLGASVLYLHAFVYREISLINVVFWSLEIEIQFYIVAPLLAFIYFLMAPRVRRALVVIAIFLLPVFQQYTVLWPVSLVHYLQYFLAGFFVCDLYVSGQGQMFRKSLVFPTIVLMLMLILSHEHSLAENILMPLLMSLFFLFALFQPTLKSILSVKFIAIIGGMCYSIYLIHFQIISAMGDYSMHYRITGNFYVNLFIQIIVIVPVVLLGSAVFYRLFEKPFMQFKIKSSN